MDKIYDAIIIGAGPAGLSSAIYAGRAELSILLVDKDAPGGKRYDRNFGWVADCLG